MYIAMNGCGRSRAKGLLINTFMPIKPQKPDGNFYLGQEEESARQALTFTLELLGMSLCVLCTIKNYFKSLLRPKQTRLRVH